MSQTTQPLSRKRPANRRELIVDAAAELFARRGFEHVSTSDVAGAVGIGPSALYRHFDSKHDLLGAAVDQTLQRFATALDDGADGSATVLGRVADFAIANRWAVVLWERETRHLSPPEILVRMRKLDELRQAFATLVIGARADPAAWLRGRAALAVLLSPAFYHAALPPAQLRSVLGHIARAVLDAELPALDPVADPAPKGLARASKREQILQAALQIVAGRTYASTSIEEIAAAVRLSPSSVYNHYGSKVEIFRTAFHRGNGYLQMTLDNVLRGASDDASALRRLVAIYVDFAVHHPGYVEVLLSEMRSLGDDSEPMLQAQRDYVGEWIRLCRRAANPELGGPTAQVTVQATLTAINDVARARAYSQQVDLCAPLIALANAALGIRT